MPEKYVPKYRAPKRSGFGRPKSSSANGDYKPGRRKEPAEPPPAHSSHVIPRQAPPKAAAASEALAPRVETPPKADISQPRKVEDLFAPDSPAGPARRRVSSDEFNAFVAKKPPEPAPVTLKAPPAPTESLKSPVSTPSDDGARQAARQETGSTLVDGDFDGTKVKSAIRGGGEAWDPFLKDPEPEHRRFSRNGGISDMERLTASKLSRRRKKKVRPEKASRPVTSHDRQQHQSLGQWFKEILILGLIAILTAVLLTNYVVQAFFIPSESMQDTLVKDDRVLVNKLTYRFRDPRPGDIIVFTSPDKNTVSEPETGPIGEVMNEAAQGLGLRSSVQDLIKRVIAVEGQTVEVKIGSVFVDGKQIDEPYRKDFLPMPDFPITTVPEGKVFVMGDNRFQSHDSRNFGPVDVDTIVGRGFALIWPIARFTWLSSSEG